MAQFLRGNQENIDITPAGDRAPGYIEDAGAAAIVHTREFKSGQVTPHSAACTGTYKIANNSNPLGPLAAGTSINITYASNSNQGEIAAGPGPHLLARDLVATDAFAEVKINFGDGT